MILLFGRYKISSYAYGYKISKAKGQQWQVMTYHDTLSDALNELFEHRVKTDTKGFEVNFDNAKIFKVQELALIKRIESIKEEMLGAVK